jgi:hypothetical protein
LGLIDGDPGRGWFVKLLNGQFEFRAAVRCFVAAVLVPIRCQLRPSGLKVRLPGDEWFLFLLVGGWGGYYWLGLGADCTTCHWLSGAGGGFRWGRRSTRGEFRIVTFSSTGGKRLGFRLQETLPLLLLGFLGGRHRPGFSSGRRRVLFNRGF